MSPRLARVARLVVVVYLCFAGWFFVLAPWTEFWGTVMIPNTPWWMMALADNPTLRGALAAFGVLHFPAAAAWLAPREPFH